MANTKVLKRERRHKKIRAKVRGTAERPRLSVFKSNRYLFAQLIDDEAGKTLAAFSSAKLGKLSKAEGALEAGKKVALLAKEKGISKAVFDRGGFLYAGRIKAFAEGARSGGLTV